MKDEENRRGPVHPSSFILHPFLGGRAMNDSGSERNPVEALAEEFLQRQRRGERPTLEDYCPPPPGLADDIRDLFPILIRMEDLGADSSGAPTGGALPAGTTARLERLGDF